MAIGIAMVCSYVGLAAHPLTAGADPILKITVGEPTALSPLGLQNSSSLAVSRTGVVAAFYPRADHTLVYRISRDGGRRWDATEHVCPEGMLPNACSTGLRGGGVIKNIGHNIRLRAGLPLAASLIRFTDDFSRYEIDVVPVHIPNPQLSAQEPSPHTWAGPIFDKGKMVQLPNGDVLAPMYGAFIGDIEGRAIVSRSNDQGRSWYYHATVGHDDEDPNPELPGEFGGYAEPSIALLPNGQMLCMMRAQYSHLRPDYKPMYVSWSDDLGKTWTRPVPTKPHLMNIWPTLAALDNGVVACAYGRPGFHVAFSIDNGHTWGDRISFSHLQTTGSPDFTGMVDMVKVGPNRLLAIGGLGEGRGTKVFPIAVERVKDPAPGPFELVGRVLDDRGRPIPGARVERGPNRYTTEYQPIRAGRGYPIVKTDGKGRFRFEGVKRGETVFTVEAEGCAPAFRHVKARPGMAPLEFALMPGRLIRGRVVDQVGEPIAGSCVIIGENGHVHTDRSGRYCWVVEGAPPAQAEVRIVKRHYLQLSRTMTLSQIQLPIVTHRLGYPKDGPQMACVRVETPPAMDAGFDSPAWVKSPVARTFWIQSTPGARRIPVEARFACDGEYLYVIVRVGGGEEVCLADEDMIELYVAKDVDHRWSFQFAHNVAGRIKGRFGWNAPWPKVRTTRDPGGGWTLSTAIKWLILDMRAPATIGLGLAHVQAPGGQGTPKGPSPSRGPPTVFRYGRLVVR